MMGRVTLERGIAMNCLVQEQGISEQELMRDVTEDDKREHEEITIRARGLYQAGQGGAALQLIRNSPVIVKMTAVICERLQIWDSPTDSEGAGPDCERTDEGQAN